jgi:hypothetical protein
MGPHLSNLVLVVEDEQAESVVVAPAHATTCLFILLPLIHMMTCIILMPEHPCHCARNIPLLNSKLHSSQTT